MKRRPCRHCMTAMLLVKPRNACVIELRLLRLLLLVQRESLHPKHNALAVARSSSTALQHDGGTCPALFFLHRGAQTATRTREAPSRTWITISPTMRQSLLHCSLLRAHRIETMRFVVIMMKTRKCERSEVWATPILLVSLKYVCKRANCGRLTMLCDLCGPFRVSSRKKKTRAAAPWRSRPRRPRSATTSSPRSLSVAVISIATPKQHHLHILKILPIALSTHEQLYLPDE